MGKDFLFIESNTSKPWAAGSSKQGSRKLVDKSGKPGKSSVNLKKHQTGEEGESKNPGHQSARNCCL